MDDYEIKVVNVHGVHCFVCLQDALTYIHKYFKDCTSSIYRKVEDKWLPVSTEWPKSNLNTR